MIVPELDLEAQDSPARMAGWATFSLDRNYRFDLGRRWDYQGGLLGWLMMNPSKAGPTDNDATITRVIGFSRALGYGGAWVANTSAYIATDSSLLPRFPPRILDHLDNEHYIRLVAQQCEAMILAFGVPIKRHEGLAQRAVQLIRRANPMRVRIYALDVTKDGWPRHPLRLPANLKPKRWEWPG